MPLVGQRVMLRALEERDLGPIWDAYQDFDLQLTTDGDAPPLSDRQVHDFWAQRIVDPAPTMRYFAVEPLEGNQGAGQFAGMCNLHDIDMRNRHAELGVWLASAGLRGHGYGADAIRALLPYAFEVVRLEKVYLGVYDFNEAGLRCYERIGFRYEGCLRHQIYYQGRCWDEWPMRLLDGEWRMIQNPPAEGLRPYHPADQTAALDLIRRELAAQDVEAARMVLRRWWRRIDCQVLSFQHEGDVLALLAAPVDGDDQPLAEIVVPDDARALVAGAHP
jgi:RimJ/RimL family protein N-acetyltransferase